MKWHYVALSEPPRNGFIESFNARLIIVMSS